MIWQAKQRVHAVRMLPCELHMDVVAQLPVVVRLLVRLLEEHAAAIGGCYVGVVYSPPDGAKWFLFSHYGA